jgi:hypothetical protein
VVVLVEDAKDPRGFFPRMVIMTPEKHQDLMDRLAQLEKLIKGDRKTPHNCKLSGTVEGETVRVVAELHFHVEQPRTAVLAGFRDAQLSEAKIRPQGSDTWQPAIVDVGAEGYQIQIDKPGDYQVVVELRVPLASANPGAAAPGTERSFVLALPGAAVTTLTLEMPEPVKELRWNKTNVEKPLAPATDQKHWQLAVGKVTQLHVAWKEPLAPGGTTPLRTVQGQVSVRVDEAQVVTTAELILTDLRGKAKDWRLLLPPQVKGSSLNIKVSAPEGVKYNLSAQGPNLHVLTLSPTSDAIKVTVSQVRVWTPNSSNTKISIGPYSVQDAVRQEGTIEVKLAMEARRGTRLTCHPSGNLEEREPPRDQAGNEVVAVYKYWDMPPPPKGVSGKELAKVLIPPLEIDRRTIEGKVETRIDHSLRLFHNERGWQILATCKIYAKPEATVDYLDVQLPRLPPGALPLFVEPTLAGFPSAVPWPAWGLSGMMPVDGEWVLANMSNAVELQYIDAAARFNREVRVKWAKPQSAEQIITLVGTYSLPAGMRKVRLELPRPMASYDRGANAQMDVGDTLELLTQDGGPELPVPQKHVLTRAWEHAPSAWDLAWRAYRPEFPIHVTTDIEFRPRFAHVKQQLVWDQADRPRGSALLRLHVPVEAKGLKVAGGGKLVALDRDKQVASIDTGEVAGKGRVILEYDFALPTTAPAEAGIGRAMAPQFRVPLIWPEQATNVDTKLRIWSQPGIEPLVSESSFAERAWKDLGTEVVAGQDSLPVKVLVNEGLDIPLLLRLETARAKLPIAIVDRVLAQVNVNEEGTEDYRVRFLLTRVHAGSIEVRMPLPVSSTVPQFLLNGKQVTWQPPSFNQSSPTPGGGEVGGANIAKLNIDPSHYGKSAILEVNYQLPRGQPTKQGQWQTTLNLPTVEGDVFIGKVRWQVALPPSVLAVAARGAATTELILKWHDWLPSLEPAISTNDLEQWFSGQELTETGAEASLVSLGNSLEPLRVIRVNRAFWFLVCSGLALLIGLSLLLHPPSPAGWLVVVVLASVCLTAVGWLWPPLLSASLYGAAPGVLASVLMFLSQWLIQERYKRQLVFMPGFTRVKGGSSLIRPTGNQRAHEPSTIDAPLALEHVDLGSNASPRVDVEKSL